MVGIIEKILVGKLFRFYPADKLNIIIAVRINHYLNLEILIARVRENKYSKRNGYVDAEMLSWYCVNIRSLLFENRQSRSDIKKCLLTNPDKVKYKLGLSIPKDRINMYKTYQECKPYHLNVYDNWDLYLKHINGKSEYESL